MIPRFQPFNTHASVDIYHRNLPHWRQKGATYFATFRLSDSIPRTVLSQWIHERETWLAANGVLKSMDKTEQAAAYLKIDAKRRRNFEKHSSHRYLTELDRCHGCCILKRPDCRSILKESMLHFNGDRYWSGDFVIMPNHVHWIVQPLDSHSLETILQSIKRFTSTRMTKYSSHAGGRLWQSESHDHIIRDHNELLRIRNYIRENPRKARLSPDGHTLYEADWLNS